ncbi:MAG: FecR domain-containing protein [Opitutales bacterium]
MLLLPFCFFVQNIEANEAGAIIVLSSKGTVNAISPTGQVVPSILKSGTVLAEGFSIKTGLTGETSILFSNGTTASIDPNSRIKISSFSQDEFVSGNRKLDDLLREPSKSQLTLDLELGTLVVQTKKLSQGSKFSINSKLGTADIIGTEFQMGLSASGNLNLDVSTSVVSFTPPGGAQAVIVTKGSGLNVSKTGGVIRRPINASIAQNISRKNKSASLVASQVALSTIKVAANKAKQLSMGMNKQNPKKSKTADSVESSDSDSEKEDAKLAIAERSSNAPRSVTGAETSLEYFKKITQLLRGTTDSDPLLNPPTDSPPSPPPSVNPGSPPTNLPGEGADPSAIASLSYEYNPANQSLIFNYLDEGGSTLSSSQLPVSNSNYESIGAMLSPWEKNQDNQLDVLGIQVFMEELVLTPSKYNNLNEALHSAIQLSRIFLTDLNIENNLPGGNVWNAQKLVGEFASNPYAFEFGQLLIKYGALGENGNSEITNIGNQIIDILGGRSNLADSNYLNTLSTKLIQPSVTYNGKTLNGNLLGTRTAKLSETDAKLLQIGLNNVNGAIGSKITIKPPSGSTKASIDVSSYLTKASSSEDKKVFAIAAVKDLHIEGDVDFKNSNHSEDHALSIGAADDIHIKEGSKIFNEGSNLGIGSYDTLQLVNVDIDTGGNLALASLEELHIRSTKPDEESALSSTFSVGRYSDSDNLYLYADQLINVDGLRFSGNLREVYMEAITIDLKNINFPSNSEVMLRSKDGYPTFGSSNRMIGAVNFIENVKHGSRSINSVQDFNTNGSNGYDSKIMSGHSAAIKIRKFPN